MGEELWPWKVALLGIENQNFFNHSLEFKKFFGTYSNVRNDKQQYFKDGWPQSLMLEFVEPSWVVNFFLYNKGHRDIQRSFDDVCGGFVLKISEVKISMWL